jgi:hypothetical protein
LQGNKFIAILILALHLLFQYTHIDFTGFSKLGRPKNRSAEIKTHEVGVTSVGHEGIAPGDLNYRAIPRNIPAQGTRTNEDGLRPQFRQSR